MAEQSLKDSDRLGRFLCYVLRHKPSAAGISLDGNGWADVNELICGVNRSGRRLTTELLENLVKNDQKNRYSFNDNHSKIRANQGHSIASIDVNLKEQIPPKVLYHGTAKRFLPSIEKYGLLKQERLYVHLSSDIETALSVGKRHGQPVVLRINTASMLKNGLKFFLSENNVWLCDHVPFEYCEILSDIAHPLMDA